jgi:predicted SnoaL-like aldol condensation-catalyzing enzyme
VEQAPTPTVGRTAYEQANVANVKAFYDAAYNAKSPVRARFYIGETYLEHDPNAADGVDAFQALVISQHDKTPAAHRAVEAAFADGDYVILHARSIPQGKEQASNVVDIYRLNENGKIVEHWNVAQPISSAEAQGAGLFYSDGSAEPVPQNHEQEEQNKRTAAELYDRIVNRKDVTAARRLLGDTYADHDPRGASGADGLARRIGALHDNAPQSRGEIKQAFVDGDRVILHVLEKRTPADRGQCVVEMFRLAGGKVVEHWAVSQPVPEKAKNGNGVI